jgi:hypothetical protein
MPIFGGMFNKLVIELAWFCIGWPIICMPFIPEKFGLKPIGFIGAKPICIGGMKPVFINTGCGIMIGIWFIGWLNPIGVIGVKLEFGFIFIFEAGLKGFEVVVVFGLALFSTLLMSKETSFL